MRQKVVHRWWLTWPLLMICLACRQGPSDWPVAVDLAAGFGVADTWTETRQIDFGSLDARRYLDAGWSEGWWNRQRGRSYVRATGAASVLHFDVIQPRPLALRFLAGLDTPASAESIAVELLINGFPIEVFEIDARLDRARVRVPAGVLRAGSNEMTLRYPEDTSTSGPPVVWYQLDFKYEEAPEPPLPVVTDSGESLMLPYGTRLEYTLELPADAVLWAEGLQFVGAAGGRLQVLLEQDRQAPFEVVLAAGETTGLETALPAVEPRLVRLTLRAHHPEAGLDGRAGVRLEAPSIRAPAAAEPELVAGAPFVGSASGERPNILLYVVDTLRADHLGFYGYDKPVSPQLDRFAAGATVFDHAIAQSSWTRASMASIFTGLWPVKHAANSRKDILDPEANTLAELLEGAGYQTEALVRNWNVFPVFGFRQGFGEFRPIREGKGDRVNQFVDQFLATRDQDRPFFLWVHTVDPHEPYRPPASTRERFMEDGQEQFDLEKHPPFRATDEMTPQERDSVARFLKALYDAEIAFNDEAFGELVTMLEQQQLLDSTLVIFVSDHGEEFLEHGTWGHGRNLHVENLDVPLVMRFPDRGHGRRVPEVVQHIDLLPTILEYVGLPVPEYVEGRSLLPLIGENADTDAFQSRPAFSYLHLDGAPNRSLIDGPWKLVQRLSDEGEPTWTALFDRRTDREEHRDLSREYPVRVRYMELLLDAKMAEGGLLTTEEAVLDEETENALKALGYLQ